MLFSGRVVIFFPFTLPVNDPPLAVLAHSAASPPASEHDTCMPNGKLSVAVPSACEGLAPGAASGRCGKQKHQARTLCQSFGYPLLFQVGTLFDTVPLSAGVQECIQ